MKTWTLAARVAVSHAQTVVPFFLGVALLALSPQGAASASAVDSSMVVRRGASLVVSPDANINNTR